MNDFDIPDGTPFDEDGELLRSWLDTEMRRLREDWDMLLIITGPERTGKSGVGQHFAAYVDPEYSPETQCTFSGEAFSRAAVELPKYSALVLDEATAGANSRRSMGNDNVGLMDWLTVGGEYNLFNIICWPGDMFLDKFLKNWRSTYNVHVIRRYRDHVVCLMRQWHDGEVVFEKPKVLFAFSMPKPEGRLWDRYRACKREATERIGRGEQGKAVAEREFMDRATQVLRPLVTELLR